MTVGSEVSRDEFVSVISLMFFNNGYMMVATQPKHAGIYNLQKQAAIVALDKNRRKNTLGL